MGTVVPFAVPAQDSAPHESQTNALATTGVQRRLFTNVAPANPARAVRAHTGNPSRVPARWQQDNGTPAEDLSGRGSILVDDLLAGVPTSRCDLLSLHDVLWEAVTLDGLSPEGALELVVSVLHDRAARGDLSPRTVAKAASLQARFTRFLSSGHQVRNLAEIDQRQVRAFMAAPTLVDDGRRISPSARTRDNRRWAIALFFSTLRDLGVGVGDPTADITVVRGSPAGARPLTDDEEALGRKHARRFSGDTRGPAAWALTRAGATTGEAGQVAAGDIDWREPSVHLRNGTREDRFVRLDAWSVGHLQARLEVLGVGTGDHAPLLYDGQRGGDSRTSSTSQVIARILRRSGLATLPGVKPSSVTAWAGRCAYDNGDLLAARQVLGLRSLDDTARAIGLDLEAGA